MSRSKIIQMCYPPEFSKAFPNMIYVIYCPHITNFFFKMYYSQFYSAGIDSCLLISSFIDLWCVLMSHSCGNMLDLQKQLPRGVPKERCSENMQQIYKRTPIQHGCSLVNLLHIFRTPFLRNTSWWLLPDLCLFMLHLVQRHCKSSASAATKFPVIKGVLRIMSNIEDGAFYKTIQQLNH